MSTEPEPHRRALITGASEGLGRAFALALAAEGHTVTAVARTEHRLLALMAELAELAELSELGPGDHDFIVADLATPEGIGTVADALTDAKGTKGAPYDLLVNNAGLAHAGPFTDTPVDRAGPMIRLNCEAVVTLSHAFLAAARPGAALVNVASTLAFTPKPGQAVYSATKAFVASFSEALWYEQKPRGVQVLALCPGPTATRPGLHDDVPSALVMEPGAVVTSALKALRRHRRPTVVPGRANAFMARVIRALPRGRALSLLADDAF
ncbi:SDR family NAD(P)-dependent oxidoreductase [Streptomyces sp. NBC_01304]|uniref:SDR family NAD(P)-dependent oxidoreductase n=1 Tax=Streptomyces sp. NBC_01304 TaxID=2903818 RepID=UPI002E11FDBB|nr:SDR family NAD(P)-dependent oxidoreductase [Streptomyces sp. NBC_01304]